MIRRITAALLALLGMPAAAMAQGMPQLDFANPLTIDQVGWGAIIFVVFFLLCWRWGLPQVGERAATPGRFDRRRPRHRTGAEGEADRAAAETMQATARARAEAQAAINAALDKAKQQGAAQAAELNARLETQLRDAEQRIDAARQGAMRALRQVATDTAATVILRLTGCDAGAGPAERAVGAALAARGQS